MTNPPPYPTQRRQALDLHRYREQLLETVYFIEKALLNRDFHDFPQLLKAKQELTLVDKKLSSDIMKHYMRISK